MKGILIKRYALFFLLIAVFFSAECIVNARVFGSFYVDYFLLEFVLYFVFLSPILIFRSEKVTVTYASILFGLSVLIMGANLVLDYSSNDVFSITYVVFIETVTNVFSFNFINFWDILLILGYITVYVLFMVFVYKRINYKKEYIASAQAIGAVVGLFLISLSFCIRGIEYNRIETLNTIEVLDGMNGRQIVTYTSENFKRSALKKYGVLNLYFGEIDALVNTNLEAAETIINDDEKAAKNNYSGSIQGYNVLEIMIETGVPFTICENLTPNLYKITTEGINMPRAYSKNKTNVSEYIGIVGSTPSPISSDGYDTSNYSLAGMLNDLGYTTSYFHNNYASFYGRQNVVEKAGFENTTFFTGDKWGATGYFDGNYPLDTDFVTENIESMIPNDGNPFYTYWTTLSTHGPYNTGKYNMEYFKGTNYLDSGLSYYNYMLTCEKNGSWVNPLADYTGEDASSVIAQVRNFECEMMNYDLALGLLLDRLEATNQLDNTLIIMYGDHDIYYESNGCAPLKNYIYNTEDPYYAEQYNTILAMYNPTLNNLYYNNTNKHTFDYFVSPYVIVPTVLDVLGIDYEKAHYIGTSIFNTSSDFDNVFYSHELEILFIDTICTFDLETIAYQKEDYDEEYIKEFLSVAAEMITKVKAFNVIYSEGLVVE